MGGYAFFVWLAVAMTVAPLALLAREARMRAAQAQQEAA
ncbi:heme exporter protein C, cytochrome c-type biogenesis protein [Salmonella enterica]|nr:heme exporter protein C, cytochrome c-type biogenesis protein [Salmonella enterica]